MEEERKMLNMSQINNIRDLDKSGYRISEISKRTGQDPKTIRKYLKQEDFSETPPVRKINGSILDPLLGSDRNNHLVSEENSQF